MNKTLQHGSYKLNCNHIFGQWYNHENEVDEFRVCGICGESQIRRKASISMVCDVCFGTGKYRTGNMITYKRCPVCGGSGKIYTQA